MKKTKTIQNKLAIPKRPYNITFEISPISHLKLWLLIQDTGKSTDECLNKLIHDGFRCIVKNNDDLFACMTALLVSNNLENKTPFRTLRKPKGKPANA